MANSGVSSDYAYINTKAVSFYYGYEVTNENGEWCFQAVAMGKTITVPFSRLDLHDMYDCAAGLRAGIALLCEEGHLVFT